MANKKATRKPRVTVPSDETKDQKFVRLAGKRVTKALNDIRLIGNLGSYPHTDAMTEAIENALNAAVDSTMLQFAKSSKKEHATFSL